MATDPYGDPGWGPALRLILPFGGRKEQRPSGLITLRVLFLTLLSSSFAILLVIAAAFDGGGSPATPIVAALAALGLAGVAGALWSRSRPLEGSSPAEVAAAYRAIFFLGFAVDEMPLLVGFVLAAREDAPWPYLAALPLYVVGMAIIAPGRRNLDRRDEQLRRRGSPVSLREALDQPLPATVPGDRRPG